MMTDEDAAPVAPDFFPGLNKLLVMLYGLYIYKTHLGVEYQISRVEEYQFLERFLQLYCLCPPPPPPCIVISRLNIPLELVVKSATFKQNVNGAL